MTDVTTLLAGSDENGAVEEATGSDWLVTDDGKHYCDIHGHGTENDPQYEEET